MRSQLRNWDSKITFFAFADIITAVSGMLIFITLLLATGLGRPSSDRAATSEIQKQLQEALSQQATADAQNSRLERLLSAAQSAPNSNELHADVSRLRAQLDEEKRKQSLIDFQIAGAQAAADAREKRLGLTEMGAEVQRVRQETDDVAGREAQVRDVIENLERQVARLQSTLLQLRQREGQIWLIPDNSATKKEPILVTIGGAGATIERFNHPEARKQLAANGAETDFRSWLGQAKAAEQYVVFLIRPSGIALFHDLVQAAHGMGFEVGYDAIEEGRQIHFSTPPPVDEPQTTNSLPSTKGQPSSRATSNFVPPAKRPTVEPNPAGNASPPVHETTKPPPPPKKSWWQRLLEWLGLA